MLTTKYEEKIDLLCFGKPLLNWVEGHTEFYSFGMHIVTSADHIHFHIQIMNLHASKSKT
jgi:hypothetical protein